METCNPTIEESRLLLSNLSNEDQRKALDYMRNLIDRRKSGSRSTAP